MVGNMFAGRYEYAIDDKGRLSIPAKFREVLASHQRAPRRIDNHYGAEGKRGDAARTRAEADTDQPGRLHRCLSRGGMGRGPGPDRAVGRREERGEEFPEVLLFRRIRVPH